MLKEYDELQYRAAPLLWDAHGWGAESQRAAETRQEEEDNCSDLVASEHEELHQKKIIQAIALDLEKQISWTNRKKVKTPTLIDWKQRKRNLKQCQSSFRH